MILLGIGLAVSALAAVDGTESAQAVPFNPITTTCLEDARTVDLCDGDGSPGEGTAITTSVLVEPSDIHPKDLILFTPVEWGVARDEDVTDGTPVGAAQRVEQVGFLGGPCVTPITYFFQMMEATTDPSLTTTFDDQFDLVSGIPRGAIQYPDYLNRILVDATATPLQARARYYGHANIEGFLFSLNLVVFEPGVNFRGLPLAPQLGYPMVAVFQNEGDPAVEPALHPKPFYLTDTCTPFRLASTLSSSVRSNPREGAYTFVTFTSGRWDADGDGHENDLDPCPFAPNPEWEPRSPVYTGDSDHDLLPDDCDPLPDDWTSPEGSINDHDGDYYYNGQDNCPFVPNSRGEEHVGGAGVDNQADTDKDGIGDSCDPNRGTPDGTASVRCTANLVSIGAGGAPALDPVEIESLQSFFPCGQPPDDVTATPVPTATESPGPTATASPAGMPVELPRSGGPPGGGRDGAWVAGTLLALSAAAFIVWRRVPA